MLTTYERSKVNLKSGRAYEWDTYLVTDGTYFLQLRIADLFTAAVGSACFGELRQGRYYTSEHLKPLTFGMTGLPHTPEGTASCLVGRTYCLLFQGGEQQRGLYAHIEHFQNSNGLDATVRIRETPKESLITALPFEREGNFRLAQKTIGMRGTAEVRLGPDVFRFDPDRTRIYLDWSRGIWPDRCKWVWAAGSGNVDGREIGFTFGYGAGKTQDASENMIFLSGSGYKVGTVVFYSPRKKSESAVRRPRNHFTTEDGSLDLIFEPDGHREYSAFYAGRKWTEIEDFGMFAGTFTGPDGKKTEFRDIRGFQKRTEYN